MAAFHDIDERKAAYKALFDSDLGRKVLEDILSHLFVLPGADPHWRSYNEGQAMEVLRNYGIYLLGAGGLGAVGEASNEAFVRKMLEI